MDGDMPEKRRLSNRSDSRPRSRQAHWNLQGMGDSLTRVIYCLEGRQIEEIRPSPIRPLRDKIW